MDRVVRRVAPPFPLRTVRVSFPTYSSGISKSWFCEPAQQFISIVVVPGVFAWKLTPIKTLTPYYAFSGRNNNHIQQDMDSHPLLSFYVF